MGEFIEFIEVELPKVEAVVGAIEDGREAAVDYLATGIGEDVDIVENGAAAAKEFVEDGVAEAVKETGSLFRSGGSNPSSLALRPNELSLSFRDSLSNPIGPGLSGNPVFRPGSPYIEVRADMLPAGSIFRDNMPPGHVGITAAVQAVKDAIIGKGTLPK